MTLPDSSHKTGPSIFLVDAVGFIFRSYYAITPMTSSEGIPTHALYGFIRSVQKLLKDFNPTHIACIFDGPDNSDSRTKIYAEYKSHRKAMPADLPYQIDLALKFCEIFGIPTLQIPGIEADDTIGSVTKWAEKNHFTTYICSSDKDLCQLVNDHVFIINTHKDNLLIDAKKVEEIFNVRPDQIVDLLALMGDASDNIPGIPGFGPKTASTLLQTYGTLDNILEQVHSIDSKKKQETIEEHKDKALLSRQLATLDLCVPVPKEAIFYELKSPRTHDLLEFYKEMSFSSLLKDLNALNPQEKVKTHYETIHSKEELDQLVDFLQGFKEIAFDTETTSLHPIEARLVGIGLCVKPGHAYYIPTNQKINLEEVVSTLKPLFENPSIGFIGHNLKYDMHILQNHGIHVNHASFDTMLASYLINSQSRKHGLDYLMLELFGKTKIPIEDLIGKGKKQICMSEVPLEKISTYCCEDVDDTMHLKMLFEKQMKEKDVWNVFKDIEMPLLPVLLAMERHGVYVDVDRLSKIASELSHQIDQIASSIYQEVGCEFNLNSPKQLGEILFEKMGFTPPSKKGVSGFSTSADVLESMQEKHPICKKILAYRGLEKLRSTYAESLPLQISQETGRIHCTFNQSMAATGRLACQDPNLQNIPVRTEEGRKIRSAFMPSSPLWSYLSADYSQIELRILAHLSQDPSLIEAFQNGADIHKYTASLVFQLPESRVSSEMRTLAKAVNFGIIYGQSAYGLSQQLGIHVHEASKFIHTYFERYPKIKSFLDSCKEKAKETGYATTFTGRCRPLPDIHSKNPILKSAAERLAINTPIQGAQADIIKIAMIKIHEKMKGSPHLGSMILQIHDELLFEVPDNHLHELTSLVKNIMENIIKLDVPLIVDVSVGKNWSAC